MEYRAGVVANERMPAGFAETPEERRRHRPGARRRPRAPPPASTSPRVGLADFGRPEGYLERQVRRWSQQWEKSKVAEAAGDRGADPAARAPRSRPRRRRRSCTATTGSGTSPSTPPIPTRIVAVFDWEMATLGDPLADLGYTLVYWGEAGDPPEARMPGGFQAVTAVPGFPTRAELVRSTRAGAGASSSTSTSTRCSRSTSSPSSARGSTRATSRGRRSGAGFENLARSSVALARQALALADASASPALRGAA